MKYAIVIWLIVTVFMTYQMSYNGTYKSDAPDKSFLEKLPFAALICGAVIFGIYGVYVLIKKNNTK